MREISFSASCGGNVDFFSGRNGFLAEYLTFKKGRLFRSGREHGDFKVAQSDTAGKETVKGIRFVSVQIDSHRLA